MKAKCARKIFLTFALASVVSLYLQLSSHSTSESVRSANGNLGDSFRSTNFDVDITAINGLLLDADVSSMNRTQSSDLHLANIQTDVNSGGHIVNMSAFRINLNAAKKECPVVLDDQIIESTFTTDRFGLEANMRSRPQIAPPSIQFSLNQSRDFIFPRNNRLKVVDGVIFNTELDLLELRMMHLYDVVDWFVVIESNLTFQNTPKRLHFAENRERFARFEAKIVYYCVTDLPAKMGDWALETHHRNAIGNRGIKIALLEEKKANLDSDDLIIVTDTDEIPQADVLNWLAWNSGYQPYIRLCLRWNLYGFMWKNPKSWCINAVAPFSTLTNCTDKAGADFAAEEIRRNSCGNAKNFFVIGNPQGNQPPAAGWHCSWCFPVALFANKMESFTHKHYNSKHFKEYSMLVEQKKVGKWFGDKPRDKNVICRAPMDQDFAPPGYHFLWSKGSAWEYLVNPDAPGDVEIL